jgi:hypothetical protein
MENVNTAAGSIGSRGLNSAKIAVYNSPEFKAFLTSCFSLSYRYFPAFIKPVILTIPIK